MPDGEGSGDDFVGHPSRDGEHSNPPVFDLLDPEALELGAVKPPLPLCESKGVVAVVPRDTAPLVVLALVGDALKPTSNEKDLQPSPSGDHLDGVKGSGSGDVREGNAAGAGEHPVPAGYGRVEHIRSRGTKVKGEVDPVLLDHKTDRSNHGDTPVLQFSVLEPGQSLGPGSLKDLGSQRGALAPSLHSETDGAIEGG